MGVVYALAGTGEGVPAMSRRAKIVCTLGPATSSPAQVAAGLDVAG